MGVVERFKSQAESWGMTLDMAQMDLLLRYAHLLGDYDKANVIGTRDVSEILIEHLLDSLSCSLFETMRRVESLLDVGSGGGLPGVPLGVALPGLRVSLLESNGKKTEFLKRVIRELSLPAVEVLNYRAEDLGSDTGFRGQYEVATVRAVASLSVLAEYSMPFVRAGGYVIAMKGRLTEEEMGEGERAVEVLGGEIREVITVPFLEEVRTVERHLVVLEKLYDTPDKYPRRAGVPKKRPLGKGK